MSTLSLLVVTGASRGLGRHIALQLVEQLQPTHVLLLARSVAGLEETAAALRVVPGPVSQPQIRVLSTDLAAACAASSGCAALWEEICSSLSITGVSDWKQFSRIVLVHNAGSLGALKPVSALLPAEMLSATHLNLTSFMFLTAQFLHAATSAEIPLTIVNISTLLATMTLPTMSLYCTLKAARETFLRSLVQEVDPPLPSEATAAAAAAAAVHPRAAPVRVLNYAPGPLADTDMVPEIIAAPLLDESVRQSFRSISSLVDPAASARKLVRLLQQEFPSPQTPNGAHVDYFDPL